MTIVQQIIRHLLEAEPGAFEDSEDWKDVDAAPLVDRLVGLGFKPSEHFRDSWGKGATRIGLGQVLGSVHLRRRTDPGHEGTWDIEVWYMGSKLETMHGVPDEDVLTKLRALPRTRDLDVIGESAEDFDSDWKDVVNPNIFEEVKREFVISVMEQEDFSREALQKALVKLGVPTHTGNLIALEWGGSQAIVNKRYLTGVGLTGSVLDSAQQFIKFAYRLQYEEDLIEKLYKKYTAP